MLLCPQCEGAGAAHPVRDPVLVGDVLAGLVDAAPFAVRGGGAVRDVRFGEAIRDVRRAAVAVPEPRSGGSTGGSTRGSTPSVPRAAVPAASACRRCGGQGAWHRTVRGRWIMIEPGELATSAVPAGSRWRVAGDGTAINLGSAVPSDTCRVSHFDVCAASPEPVGSLVLLALWRAHARRIA
ncbi:DUF6083 domain-containing protein [Streptomyces sp. NPDC006553]|uniref:DUF6083 domain-containing protein n=1 Tax=unclassified Streptomyces TaxID=2593676 RepID=UPI0022514CF5|nr:DUF6083 domain-containing protein [Streptomyces sp. NBC_00233]MCX5227407.1 DUF6083 domain-containing protein [Streptomyces sp. NBC_00233]